MRRPDLKELRSRVEVKCRKGYGKKRCWLWEGAMNNGATPFIKVADQKLPAASIMVGDLEAGVNHTCGNDLCMKPDHLSTEPKLRVDGRADWDWVCDETMLNRLRVHSVRSARRVAGVNPDDIYSEACIWLAAHPEYVSTHDAHTAAMHACDESARSLSKMAVDHLDETSFEDWYDYEEGAF